MGDSLQQRARQCENEGRFIEAQDLYDECADLMNRTMRNQDRREEKQRSLQFCQRQSEYIDEKCKRLLARAKRVEYKQVEENSTGNNYDVLFGKYFDKTTREILIKDPYIHHHFQFQNLIRLFELAVTKCPNLQYIRLITTKDRNKDNIEQQQRNFDQIQQNMLKYRIRLTVKYDARHDRIIILNNNYMYSITIQRGLDIYKGLDAKYSIGLVDYNYRKCRETDISICRSKNNCGDQCSFL